PFLPGVLATLVATPCSAPFMGAALGFALTQPWPVALSIFEALGFGLAFPYLVMSFFPAVFKYLPKPGT
ncbi:MAG: thiol:disulfide interchange protein, partial [Candidatus Competibacteraceae bacterium]|nr:thiol:disulfide interchange protein [Candidatus Competibacteraceae bacterium]